jgi:ethanolamine transporter EutH
MNLFSTFRLWYEAGKPALVVRSAALGMASGLAAWVLVYGIHLVFDTGMPSRFELVFAVALGALLGSILALIFAMRWERRSGAAP